MGSAEMAEPIEIPFGRHSCRSLASWGGADWRHLANLIEHFSLPGIGLWVKICCWGGIFTILS